MIPSWLLYVFIGLLTLDSIWYGICLVAQMKGWNMNFGYTNGNVRLADGDWRLKFMAIIGSVLGVGFHYHGLPFGRDLTHPAYPVKEVPEGTCQRAGTF